MDVAEESFDIDRPYVEKRLTDRRDRVDALYSDGEAWLPNGWSMSDGDVVPIHEDLMVRFAVPQQTLPFKTVSRHGTVAGRIVPRGLWNIGANGRVDVILADRHCLLVDRAEIVETPDRQVSSLMPRRDRRRLTRDVVAPTFQ